MDPLLSNGYEQTIRAMADPARGCRTWAGAGVPASFRRRVDGALEKSGGIGILVNNAGGSAREKNVFFH